MAQKRKRNKKWIYWLVILVLLVVAGVVVYLVWDNYFKEQKPEQLDTQGQEQVENQDGDEKKSEKEDTFEKPKTTQYDGDDPNLSEELSGAVTYAEVVNRNLMIRVNIDQYLEDGECNLVLSRGGNNIYNSVVKIVGNVTTATCEGFDIPVDELDNGEVNILININSGEKNGAIRGEVNI